MKRNAVRSVSLLSALVTACLMACFEPLSLEGRPCPCATGYTCCASLGVCTKFCATEGLPPLVEGPIARSARTAAGDPSNALVGDAVTAVAVDRKGHLWVGTRCGGLFRRTEGDLRVFHAYNAQLPDSGIHTIMVDHANVLWVASRRGFLYAVNEDTFTVFGSSPLIHTGALAHRPLQPAGRADVWFAAHSGGLAHLGEGAIDALVVTPWQREEDVSKVTSLAAFGAGAIWGTARETGTAAALRAGAWGIDSVSPGPVRFVGGTAGGGRLWATDDDLLVETPDGARPVAAPAAADKRGLAFVARGPRGALAGGYLERSGLLWGNEQEVQHLTLEDHNVLDVAFDGVGGAFVASGVKGLLRVNATGGIVERQPVYPDPLDFPWRNQPLATLARLPAIEISPQILVANPFSLVGQKVHLRGRVIAEQPSLRMVDSEGQRILIAPTIRRDLLVFWQAQLEQPDGPSLPYWAGGESLIDFYGFIEVGGCFGVFEQTSLQFLITEYHRADASPAERESVISRLPSAPPL